MPSESQILRHVSEYYTAKLAAYGATARGVDWNGEESQTQRHRQFLRLLENRHDVSILDLGCGYGDFLRFLRSEGFSGTYIGYDVAPKMIETARRLYGEDADRRWHVGAQPAEVADFAVASGILNVKGDVAAEEWTAYVRSTIDTLARAGRSGFAFNVLSQASDPARRRPDLYYADPAEMIAYCSARFGRSIALLQDYGLWEFTVLVRCEQ